MTAEATPSIWTETLARYDAARTVEDAYCAEHIDGRVPDSLPIGPERSAAVDAIPAHVWAEASRLADLRYIPEDELLAMPSPDLAAFARKVIICRADNRDLNGLDDMLVAEARRLTAPAEKSAAEARWDDAVAQAEAAYDAEIAYWNEHVAPIIPDTMPDGPERLALYNALPDAVVVQVNRNEDRRSFDEDVVQKMPAPNLKGFVRKLIICGTLDEIELSEANRLLADDAA